MLQVVAEKREEFLESLSRRRIRWGGAMVGGSEIEVRGSDEVIRCSFTSPAETNWPAHAIISVAFKFSNFLFYNLQSNTCSNNLPLKQRR